MSRAGSPTITPPSLADDLGGGGSGWVSVARADNDINAHLLAGRLEESGIETRLMTDRGASAAWLFGGSNPASPVLVMVRRIQYEDARIVMAEISMDAPSATPRSQPTNGSLRRPLIWWVIALLLGILLTGLSLTATAGDLNCKGPVCTVVNGR